MAYRHILDVDYKVSLYPRISWEKPIYVYIHFSGVRLLQDNLDNYNYILLFCFRKLFFTFLKLFRLTFQEAEIVIPDGFSDKVRKWLGNKEELFTEAKKQVCRLLSKTIF